MFGTETQVQAPIPDDEDSREVSMTMSLSTWSRYTGGNIQKRDRIEIYDMAEL